MPLDRAGNVTGNEAGRSGVTTRNDADGGPMAVVFMQRALELAHKGVGWCSPNPPVGAVVVKDGAVVGEGYHAKAGTAHAEVAALEAAGADSRGATLFVTLEPCNHQGRTPPCVDTILASGIQEVVVGTADPNPNVAGGGVARLLSSGVAVTTGICEDEARDLIRMFAWHSSSQRPYVVAKFGASLDGKIATRTGESKWITGDASRRRVHDLRHAVDAILVGVETVVADDPRLDARRDVPSSNPRPVVLDSSGRIPVGSSLVRRAHDNNLLVVTTAAMPRDVEDTLAAAGVEVWRGPTTEEGRVHLPSLLERLGTAGVQSLLVEGGATVLGSFFDQRLVNEVWAFTAPIVIGGRDAPGAVGGSGLGGLSDATRFAKRRVEQLDDDILIRLTNPIA